MSKTVITAIILVVGFFILYTLIKQIFTALSAGSRLDNLVEEVSMLQSKNQKLKKNLEFSKSYEFVEEVARNKLNYSKTGETVVIISPGAINQILSKDKKPIPISVPYWQGWLKLIVH